MEKLRVINVQQELTITQMNSEKEIAGLKAKLESGPSNNGILVQKIDEMAKQMDGMAKQIDELKKQSNQVIFISRVRYLLGKGDCINNYVRTL